MDDQPIQEEASSTPHGQGLRARGALPLLLLALGCCTISVLPLSVRRLRERAADSSFDAKATAIALDAAASLASGDLAAGEVDADEVAADETARARLAADALGTAEFGSASALEAAPSSTPEVIFLVVTATAEISPVVGSAAAETGALATPTQPADAQHLQALIAYAESVKPLLEVGLLAAQRDGAILEAAKGSPEALCGSAGGPHPDLLSDAATMRSIVEQLQAIQPPAEAAAAVHQPLGESARLWADALDAINTSCGSENPIQQGLQRAGALLSLGASILNFGAARERYQALVVAYGIEAVVGALSR
jgi:hypothetical protein